LQNILFIVLELGTGFTRNLDEFLACRALFGIAMGGLYGNAVATALEDAPEQASGILSGLFQMGYPTGYLLAVAFGRALVDTTSHGWRPLFWFGACPPALIIIYRYFLPETQAYQNRELARKSASSTAAGFFADAKLAVKNHWLIFTYMVLLMASLNFMVSLYFTVHDRPLISPGTWSSRLLSNHVGQSIWVQSR
jgi:SHS family lactate transporter-like MFS transporter